MKPRTRVWPWLTILGLLAFVLTWSWFGLGQRQPVAVRAAEPQSTPVVRIARVIGTGRVTLSPDMAIVRLGVRTQDPDVSVAVAENIRRARAVYDALKAQGVAERDLHTANLRVYRTVIGPSNNTKEVYVAENTVVARVRDLDTLGDVLGAALSAGANMVQGLTFQSSKYNEALVEARRLALEDAKAQASLMAEVLDMTLGPPRHVSFAGSPMPRAEAALDMPMAASKAADMEVPVEAGELQVTVQVNVEFELNVP
ncbi:MAG: SIMPL domain-containing protein [Chloroflexi bacterium]|nr:SIMPL domain-containing protein [Chloroflexota bacterium]